MMQVREPQTETFLNPSGLEDCLWRKSGPDSWCCRTGIRYAVSVFKNPFMHAMHAHAYFIPRRNGLEACVCSSDHV